MTVEGMNLSGLERSALEMYARNLDSALDACEAERASLQRENVALRAALLDVEVLARDAAADGYAAAELAHMVRVDSTQEDDQ